MARPPPDPRVTDLRRYRRDRERARRRPAQPPQARPESFLGSNPRARLILAVAIVVIVGLWALQALR